MQEPFEPRQVWKQSLSYADTVLHLNWECKHRNIKENESVHTILLIVMWIICICDKGKNLQSNYWMTKISKTLFSQMLKQWKITKAMLFGSQLHTCPHVSILRHKHIQLPCVWAVGPRQFCWPPLGDSCQLLAQTFLLGLHCNDSQSQSLGLRKSKSREDLKMRNINVSTLNFPIQIY